MLFKISILGVILLAGYCSGLCGGCGSHKIVSTQDPRSGNSTVTQDPESCSSTITADPGGSSTVTQNPESGSSTVTDDPGSESSTVTGDPGSDSSTVTTQSSTSTTLGVATAFCRKQGTAGEIYPAPGDTTCKNFWVCIEDSDNLRGVEYFCTGAMYFHADLKRCKIGIPSDC